MMKRTNPSTLPCETLLRTRSLPCVKSINFNVKDPQTPSCLSVRTSFLMQNVYSGQYTVENLLTRLIKNINTTLNNYILLFVLDKKNSRRIILHLDSDSVAREPLRCGPIGCSPFNLCLNSVLKLLYMQVYSLLFNILLAKCILYFLMEVVKIGTYFIL